MLFTISVESRMDGNKLFTVLYCIHVMPVNSGGEHLLLKG